LLIALGIVALGVAMYAVARETSVFGVRQIEVVGGSPGVAQSVREALAPLQGSSLVTFDAHDANRRLADVAEVASATYNRDFPHTLVVSVRSEHSVALLRRGSEAWLVSDGARVLRQIQRPFPALPRVWIPPTADPLDGAVLDGDAALAVRAIPPMTHALRSRVRSVRAVDGELAIVLESGTEILLGDASRLRLKLAVAAKILPSLTSETYLDVSVPERAVAGTAAPTTLNPEVEP
jgi:cell division protein FtsQ